MSFSRMILRPYSRPRVPHLEPRAENLDPWRRRRAKRGLDAALDRLDGSPLSPAERRGVTINDRALLIYTSGTTGLPKAASISHRRILNWGGWFAGLTGATPEDRLYDCLPVCHSVGGIVAPCSMLSAGASVVLSDKFSVSRFLARHRALGLHAVPVYRRALPLSAEGAAIRIRNQTSAAAGLRQRSARRHLGSLSGALCAFRGSSNSMRRPKAISRSTMSRASPARSAGFRRCWRIAFRRRSFGSMPSSASPFATPMVFASPARAAKSAKPSAGSARPTRAAAASRAIPMPARPKRRSCATCCAKGDAWFRTGDLMRLDEQGYLPLRRSGRRYLPLEGRERRDLRSERSRRGLPRRCRCRRPMAWKFPAPMAAPEWLRSWSTIASTSHEFAERLARRLPVYACRY